MKGSILAPWTSSFPKCHSPLTFKWANWYHSAARGKTIKSIEAASPGAFRGFQPAPSTDFLGPDGGDWWRFSRAAILQLGYPVAEAPALQSQIFHLSVWFFTPPFFIFPSSECTANPPNFFLSAVFSSFSSVLSASFFVGLCVSLLKFNYCLLLLPKFAQSWIFCIFQ